MKRGTLLFVKIGLVLCSLLSGSIVNAEDRALHSVWGALLEVHVKNGVVDYQGFKKDEGVLDGYLDTLNRTDPADLSDDERLAFYINAYNAYTVKLILDNFSDGKPPSSIRKIGGFFTNPWKLKIAGINGEKITLDDIEHGIIRVEFDEPRIHFSVNCASISCPPLLSEPYLGETIDAQLTMATKAFLADREFNYLEGNNLYISSIFKWYGEDFEGGPVPFFLKYTSGDIQQKLESAGDSIRVKYLDYDWSLNNK
ncbi:MAG: DUF547 domain-containing protein [Desulfobulbaceae bacterium]|nr:MAG: DUF547 domain-containing protein [Desulfobulbaceae bacterium]